VLGLEREPLFKLEPFHIGAGAPTLPAVADLNGDGAPELLINLSASRIGLRQ